VHFVVLNSILTYDDWTFNRWPSAKQRMLEMAGLDNPNGSPFMVGDKQREWLKQDLDKVDKNTPLVVLSHSPLQKICKGWNFWTEDAEQVQALLKPFKKVNVLYGHVIRFNTTRSAISASIPALGTNGVACAQCHPNAANTHPETYPKFQKQLGKVVPLWEMVNGCIRNPLEGKDLAAADAKMVALQAYMAYERRGVKLAPGKH
jgi:hypothetical protein